MALAVMAVAEAIMTAAVMAVAIRDTEAEALTHVAS